MYDKINDKAKQTTESRTLKWFLALFYAVFFFYEIFYHLFYRQFMLGDNAVSLNILNAFTYILFLTLLPISYLMIKKGKLFNVKYFMVGCYFLISLVSESVYFLYTQETFRIGNIAEIFLLLLSPIFVNTSFFWFVCIGLVSKYFIVGLLSGLTEVGFAIILVIILACVAFIILKRFQVYVGAIKTSYDKQLEGVVRGVIATIELKDPYTRGHSERVAYYASSLATGLNKFSKSELKSFYYACLLHDIGKVSIPDKILMKPGRLTAEEYEIIKTHPAVGTEAIRKVDGLNMSIDVIMYHHERWDGTGYPEQLKAEEIPLLARVVTIADAFDAMTSSRSYRSALSVEDAYNRIVEGKGSQFDPKLVEAFQKIFPEWEKFHKSFEWSGGIPLQNKQKSKEVPK